jgi:hypothetical protein
MFSDIQHKEHVPVLVLVLVLVCVRVRVIVHREDVPAAFLCVFVCASARVCV